VATGRSTVLVFDGKYHGHLDQTLWSRGDDGSMEGDLKTASEELVKVRRERLRALYAADRASWQERLGAMGLTMETS
jgi:glutamate-1-semialdehyde aminotransferase